MRLQHLRHWVLTAGLIAAVGCGSAAVDSNLLTNPPESQAANGQAGAQETQAAAPDPSKGGEATAGETAALAIPTGALTPGGVPMVDTSIHHVPLEDIVFDTFSGFGRTVPLSAADDELILRLRDVIAPIDQPVYGGPGALPWLEDDDLVLGYRSGDAAFAYPVNVLNFRELVTDEIGGVPVLITYCPLCFSGVVFDREVDGQVLTFGNTSALYQSDLVMYDHQTGSYWFQVGGEAVVGTLTGARLKILPSTTMEWGRWRSLYPGTKLLVGTAQSPEEFGQGRYGRGMSEGFQDSVNREDFAFPVSKDKLDPRLSAGEIVVTIEVDGSARAYPLGILGDAAVNDSVGGQPVVLLTRKDNRGVGVFASLLKTGDGSARNENTLTFEYREDDDVFVDRGTGSVWDVGGWAISGPLKGAQLEPLNTRRAFWFSIAIAFPGIDLFLP